MSIFNGKIKEIETTAKVVVKMYQANARVYPEDELIWTSAAIVWGQVSVSISQGGISVNGLAAVADNMIEFCATRPQTMVWRATSATWSEVANVCRGKV